MEYLACLEQVLDFRQVGADCQQKLSCLNHICVLTDCPQLETVHRCFLHILNHHLVQLETVANDLIPQSLSYFFEQPVAP